MLGAPRQLLGLPRQVRARVQPEQRGGKRAQRVFRVAKVVRRRMPITMVTFYSHRADRIRLKASEFRFRIKHFDRKRTFEQFKKRMEQGLDPVQQKEFDERQKQQQKQ